MLIALEGLNHLPFPAPLFGVITMVAALIGLAAVLGIGASRPHS